MNDQPTFEDLYGYVQEIYRLSSLISIKDVAIRNIEAVLTAIDLSFDEQIYQMGKQLPNETARKLYKETLRGNHERYQKLSSDLLFNKTEKVTAVIDRERAYNLLSVGKLYVKSEQLKTETNMEIN